jgi:hypothetical protein
VSHVRKLLTLICSALLAMTTSTPAAAADTSELDAALAALGDYDSAIAAPNTNDPMVVAGGGETTAKDAPSLHVALGASSDGTTARGRMTVIVFVNGEMFRITANVRCVTAVELPSPLQGGIGTVGGELTSGGTGALWITVTDGGDGNPDLVGFTNNIVEPLPDTFDGCVAPTTTEEPVTRGNFIVLVNP